MTWSMLWSEQGADPIHLRNRTHDLTTIQLSLPWGKKQTKRFTYPEQKGEIDWTSMRISKVGIIWPGRGLVTFSCSPYGSRESSEILLPDSLLSPRHSAVTLPSPLGICAWFLNNYRRTWGTENLIRILSILQELLTWVYTCLFKF